MVGRLSVELSCGRGWKGNILIIGCTNKGAARGYSNTEDSWPRAVTKTTDETRRKEELKVFSLHLVIIGKFVFFVQLANRCFPMSR